MSHGQKLMERPKVRFCQTSVNSSSNSEICTENPDQAIPQSQPGKPQVKSVISLKDPFKVTYKNGNISCLSKGNIENVSVEHSSKSTCNPQSSTDTETQRSYSGGSCNTKLTTLSKPDSFDIQGLAKSQQSMSCTNNLEKGYSNTVSISTEGCATNMPLPSTSMLKDITSSKKVNIHQSKSASCLIPEPSVPSTELKNTSKIKTGTIAKPLVCTSRSESKFVTAKTVPCTGKKVVKKSGPISDENVKSNKNVTCKSNASKVTRQKEKTPSKVVPCSSRTVNMKKSTSCGLKISKPGTKIWKAHSRSSPVKKTILRDVTGRTTNVCVGPGVVRYYPQPFKPNMENEVPHIRTDIVSGEQLGRPEYNSIMCTIEELKKAQAEKFVTDVDHLPLVYRNLVNQKVSAALDFPIDEAIYKNLVDLSVNENQLPSRLIRSKDPEPRHRDIVPKLSDFFKPSYSEEYCIAVQIRPSSPEISRNWSAFTISDKIFGWKHDMDQHY
ncbi:uncharacterized protein LOC124310094 isoform X1 [Neodiprion virginianus]|uniref:uncharacterized protein LOC124310094 isoform X1 n=1 Tax=Neodiprion virginianus TaxID=2961670 RepID=UPI001EE6A9DE|nr:uncharacterized protein LOC124310094 isoform X1 [Neodiprion virginianus]